MTPCCSQEIYVTVLSSVLLVCKSTLINATYQREELCGGSKRLWEERLFSSVTSMCSRCPDDSIEDEWMGLDWIM